MTRIQTDDKIQNHMSHTALPHAHSTPITIAITLLHTNIHLLAHYHTVTSHRRIEWFYLLLLH